MVPKTGKRDEGLLEVSLGATIRENKEQGGNSSHTHMEDPQTVQYPMHAEHSPAPLQ